MFDPAVFPLFNAAPCPTGRSFGTFVVSTEDIRLIATIAAALSDHGYDLAKLTKESIHA